MFWRYILSLTVVLLSIVKPSAQDITGSKDHPVITRYPGSVIQYYEEQKYAPYKVASGPETGYRTIGEWVETEGKLTRIYYKVTGTTTVTEVYRNYITALNKGGFTILAQGIDDKSNVSKEVGGRTHLGTFYKSNPFPTNKGIYFLNGSSTSGGSCYIAAKLTQGKQNLYMVIGGTQYKSDEKYFLVDIVEETKMDDELITVSAANMKSDIDSKGKVALYAIYFDFDKAIVKPESAAALTEIARLLKENPTLNIYVVGHTDLKGTLEYNLNLSKQRAEAVVKELLSKYSIGAERLSAQGVGPLVPIMSNKNEKGRSANRRVELVER